jgi:isopenicillin-N N-acyltransferase like protein
VGGPRDLGLQHGRAAGDLIRSAYATRMRRACQGSEEAAVLGRAMAYQFYVEMYCPELIDEIAGIADGAGMSFEAVLFLQVATELELAATACDTPVTDGCSSLGGVDPEAGPFIGQNWDQPQGTYETQIILRLIPVSGPALIMFTRAGVVGYIGVNAAGVGHVNNQLYASSPPGLTGYFITRKFLGFESVKEAISWLQEVQVGSSGNYLLGDARTLVDVELGNGQVAKIVTPIQLHTNHYLTKREGLGDRASDRLPDSYDRYDRLMELFGRRGTYGAAVAALKDHSGYPKSVCRHEDKAGLSTVASVLIKLRTKQVLVCQGNPCEGAYTSYALDHREGLGR